MMIPDWGCQANVGRWQTTWARSTPDVEEGDGDIAVDDAIGLRASAPPPRPSQASPTSASTARRIGSGSVAHAATTRARSGSLRVAALGAARRLGAVTEVLEKSADSDVSRCFAKAAWE